MATGQHTRDVMVTIIACAARNGTIGRGGAMPWRMPSDLKYFKALTLGKPVIMGRKTYQSIGKALPGRVNIVVTRRAGFTLPDAIVVPDLVSAIEEGRRAAAASGASEVMVIGGGEIYAQALPLAARVYLTKLAADIDGDAVFPELSETEWRIASRTPLTRTAKDDFDGDFIVFERHA